MKTNLYFCIHNIEYKKGSPPKKTWNLGDDFENLSRILRRPKSHLDLTNI